MATRRSEAPPQRLILDAVAVIALSRSDARARAVLAAAVEAGADVSIPAMVRCWYFKNRASIDSHRPVGSCTFAAITACVCSCGSTVREVC